MVGGGRTALLPFRSKIAANLLLAAFVTVVSASGQTVSLEKDNATVWLREQSVAGQIDGGTDGTLFVNGQSRPFTTDAGRFELSVTLGEGENVIVACTDGDSGSACSDTLRLALGYSLRPEVFAYAQASDQTVTLHSQILETPSDADLSFRWSVDPANPSVVTLAGIADSVATVSIPGGAPDGEYYFNLVVTDSEGREGRSRTFVTIRENEVKPFDIWSDHAAWVDEAVIYEVTPYNFVERGDLAEIVRRLPEIKELGVTAIWIQPVFETARGGQGYDITNYFEFRRDYGTKEDLRQLVDQAHAMGMKVLLDFVPNHTSDEHPYALHAAEAGVRSHYYDFYMREKDNVAYSRHYKSRSIGEMDFLLYFWQNLLLVDWNNPEVQRWMNEAGRYWVDEFDIDGYRIDAVWGLNARTPEAMKEWRFALKRMKPELLLLGEDKATEPASFDRRFDVAYDWYPGEGWVSHWTWQTDFSETSNPTIFNTSNENVRSDLLRASLTNRGDGFHPDAKVLRFMENNDTFHFIEHHGPGRTRMAAALLFSLPGIPMMYNGQEIGISGHPYRTFQVYMRNRTMREQDRHDLFSYYEHLVLLRKSFPALYSETFAEITVSPGDVAGKTFAFRRWEGEEHIVVVANMGATPARTTLGIPADDMGLSAPQTYYLTDLISGQHIEARGDELSDLTMTVMGYTTRIFALDDQRTQLPVGTENKEGMIPREIVLSQNYPNPFAAHTTITFELPVPQNVRLAVYDLLGREVHVLASGEWTGGKHEIIFDAGTLPSGVYFYRLEAGGHTVTRQMSVIR